MQVALTILVAVAVSPLAQAESVIDFRNDIVPVLTKHGCNAGACHGAAIGRGGFKLSLYGGNPAADYNAVARQIRGRRINLEVPEESLVVLKPTEFVEHGGGTIFDHDSKSAQLLVNWIRQGAPNTSRRQLERVEIHPPRYVAKSLGESVPLRSVAHYSDGSSRDVTEWTTFVAEDSAAVAIDASAATLRTIRRGRHLVIARYLSEVVPVEVIAPLSDAPVNLAGEARNNFIDDEILDSLATLRIEPSGGIRDELFLRRLSLDLTGRLPRVDEVREFLASDRHDKRAAIVDQLLASEEFVEYWTLQLAKLLRIRPQRAERNAASTYHHWVADQIRQDVSYREIARQLLLATGDSHEYGPANFYRTVDGPRKQVEFVSELFMGSRLRCANCHNHPLDRWTQDDYHGLAAIFAKLERGRVVRDKPAGRTIHPRTLEPATQRIPGENYLTDDEANGRQKLADWLTDPANPYFAKAIVNRLWKHMMGRGLVEPADDFRNTNPPTHPKLLDELAEDFVGGGYHVRHTLRRIANSRAYARSANATSQNKDDPKFYSHALRRPLEAEVLADAISDVLQVSETYGDATVGTRAIALMDPQLPSRTLDVLGRCGREDSCENFTPTISGLSQKLHLLNGPLLNARIGDKQGRLHRLLAADRPTEAILSEFYLAALGREMTARERQHWLRESQSAKNEAAYLEDFVWGLVTSEEFVTNH